MTLKILLLFYRQTGFLYLTIHGVAAYLAYFHNFSNVLFLLFFLKTGQYGSVWLYYRKFNSQRLIPFMNLGVKLRDLFLGTYVFDMLLLIIALYLARL